MGNETYTIDLDYDARKADASLAGFRARIISQLTELQTKSANIKLLQGLSDEAVKSERSLSDLRTRAEELKRVLGTLGQGDAGLSKLSTELKSTSAEIKALETSLAKGSKEFSKLTASSAESAVAIQAAFAKVAQLRSAFDGLEKGDAAFKSISASLKVAERDFAKLEATAEKNAARLQDIATASQTANERLRALRDSASTLEIALKKTTEGQVGYATLTANLKAVEKEMRAAEKAAAGQTDKLKALEVELGISAKDTNKLAAEQLALTAAFDKAKAAASVQNARSTLGVTGADEARVQIEKLRESYALLSAAQLKGKISAEELTQAKTALNTKIREVQASMEGASRSSANLTTSLLAISAGTVAIGTQLVTASKAAISFEQGIARISSISNFSISQLQSLKRKVLELTQSIGIDAPTALRALYEIISSGIPEQNALTVFEKASKAAIAGFTDVDTAARIGVSVINAYGLQITQLDSVYDKLFVTVRDGIVTFPQLAQDLGTILPAAKQAGVSLDQVSAALVTLTRSGFSVPEAATGIENAIKALAAPAPEAAAALRDAGISVGDFAKTLEDISTKKLSLSFLREIIPDARAIRAVAAITQNYSTYSEAIRAAGDSAGEAQKAFKKLADTPEQQIKKFTASIEALRIAIGEGLLKNALGFINAAADLLRNLNELDKGTVALTASLGAAGLAGGLAIAASKTGGLLTALGLLSAKILGYGAAFAGGFLIGEKLAEEIPRVKVFSDALGAFLGYAVTGVSEGFNLLSANIKGNVAEQERATAALARNSAQYREYEGVTQAARLQIAELEKAQNSLTKSLDAAKNAAIDQTAKYGTALAPVIAAVDDAFNKVTNRINAAEGVIKLYVDRLGTAQEANKQLFDSGLTSITVAAATATAAIEAQLAKSQLAQVISSAQTTSLIIDQLQKREITQIEAERLITNEVLVQGGRREISQIEAQKKIVAIAIDSNQKQLAELGKYAASALSVLDQQNEARLALAIKTNGALVVLAANASAEEIAAANKKNSAVLAVDIKNKEAKLALLNTLRGDYQKYIDFLVSEEQRFLGIAKDLNEKRRAFNTSIEDKLRELARGGLDAYQARADKILEIEQKLALARQALANGNTKLAEEYAQKAISLAEQTATAVKSADGKEIAQKQALYEAQQLILGGQNIVNEAINQEGNAATKAADAFAKQRTVAVESLQAIKAQVDEVTASLSKDVSLRIKLDSQSLTDELDTFRADIEKQEAIQKVKLQFAEVKADVEAVKKSIEQGLDGIEVHARIDKLETDIKAGIAALPDIEITVKDDQIKALNTEFDALVEKAAKFTTVKFTVESNVKKIAEEITDLSKLDTKSKHTVVVTYVTADGKPALPPTSTTVPLLTTFNRGGLVSMPQLQAFARGGSVADYGVFGTAVARRAAIAKFANGGSVSKVPGSGNSDTVFANLRKGDFILRKKPSELLELLAAQNAFTTPRGVGGDPSNQNAYTRARGIGGDPNNPNDLTRLRGFTAGATGVAGSGSIENAPVTKSADQDLIAKLRAAPVFERSSLLDGVMAATVNAQLAWIKKARTAFGPNGVDSKAEFNTITQGRAFAQSIDEGYARAVTTRNSGLAEDLTARVANGADAAFKTLAGLTVAGRFDGFATGGEADANIPALLTPGELHFDAAAVRKIGLANLLALNAVNSEKDMMQRFRLAAASFVNMPVPPVPTFGDRFAASSLGQSIERFNAGGAVSNSTSNANSTNNVTFSPTVTINAASDVNIKQTVRALLPEFKETLRREGINLTGKR